MKFYLAALLASLSVGTVNAHAAVQACDQIAGACKNAGFARLRLEGEGSKIGARSLGGLFLSALDRKAQPANAKMSLPSVDTATVSACKARP